MSIAVPKMIQFFKKNGLTPVFSDIKLISENQLKVFIS